MTKRNAWKVEPKLIDRFLDVLTDNDFQWMGGKKANKFKPPYSETYLFIEGQPRRIKFMEYYIYLDYLYIGELDEEYNITEVTEEWLKEMEKK